MKVIRRIADLPAPEGPLGFVPTMGAFHDGHLELMRQARRQCGRCAVSLFVNPTQFAAHEDLANYPRDEARDFELAEAEGVEFIFAPGVEEMYGNVGTVVTVSGVSRRWEGEYRPTHFSGVATICLKLFNLVRPTHAFFGEKDFQQCAVVIQMVRDLNVPLEVVLVPTVREADGLARSSRNVYLSPTERQVAPILYRVLVGAAEQLRGGRVMDSVLPDARERLNRAGFVVQYLVLVDASTLEPLTSFESHARLLFAGFLGKTRLIDNVAV